jgi:hypothetical protein
MNEVYDRLARRLDDEIFRTVNIVCRDDTDTKLVDSLNLMLHPNDIKYVKIRCGTLSDTTGATLALCVMTSSTIKSLDLECNKFGDETYYALAMALCVNSSLRVLKLSNYHVMDPKRVCFAFISALRLNPIHSIKSIWCLEECDRNDFPKLKYAAEKWLSPSMLEFLLCVHLNTEQIEIKTH